MRARAEAATIGSLAIIAIAATLLPALAPLRPCLAMPLVLLLPGLAVSRALFPRGAASFELLVLACGLSLAITIVAGLALNAGGALTPIGWVGALGGVTLLSCLVRLLGGPSSTPMAASDGDRFHVTIRQATIFAVGALIALLGVGLARVGAMSQREFSFTEFWMTPREPAAQNVVTIGITNEERAKTDYWVVIVSDGAMIGRWPPVSLDPGATWTVDISLNSELRRARKVEAWLYRDEDPGEVYRKVWLAASVN